MNSEKTSNNMNTNFLVNFSPYLARGISNIYT